MADLLLGMTCHKSDCMCDGNGTAGSQVPRCDRGSRRALTSPANRRGRLSSELLRSYSSSSVSGHTCQGALAWRRGRLPAQKAGLFRLADQSERRPYPRKNCRHERSSTAPKKGIKTHTGFASGGRTYLGGTAVGGTADCACAKRGKITAEATKAQTLPMRL